MEKLRVFDGVRGLAFLIVLCIHAVALGAPQLQPYLQGTGKYGVWLFFVLSAFLLTKNYLEASGSKAEYAIGRVVRIVPPYYVACLVYGLAGVVVTLGDIPAIASVTFGALHLWTIPAEFYFYGVLLLLWCIPNVRMRDAAFAVGALVSAVALSVYDKHESSMNTLWYLPAFFVGYGLARVWPHLPTARNTTAICAGVLAVLVTLSPGVLHLAFGIAPRPYLMNWYLPLSLLWAVFIYAAGHGEGLPNRVLSSPAFVGLGKVSYSGYLFHWLVLVLTVKYVGPGLPAILLGVLASIAAAALAYVLMEKPLTRLRRAMVTTAQLRAREAINSP